MTRMTIEEFWTLQSDDETQKLWELIDGVLIKKSVPNRLYSWIGGRITYYLKLCEEKYGDAYVFGASGAYSLDKYNVVTPQSSFILKARLPVMNDMKAIVAPDLAVEIISPSETPRMVNNKTALYLNSGATMVWNVYPDDRIIEVWTQGDTDALEMRVYTTEDTIDGGSILPGFELIVKEVFPIDDTSQDDA